MESPLVDGSGFYDDLRAVRAGSRWQETAVYRQALAAWEAGQRFMGTANERQFLTEWCALYDGLLREISDRGYLSQEQLACEEAPYLPLNTDEVTVAIGRDGTLLVWHGRHRVACATVLEIPAIPALVVFRHPQWVAFRQAVECYVADHGVWPKGVSHPDLETLRRSFDQGTLSGAVYREKD